MASERPDREPHDDAPGAPEAAAGRDRDVENLLDEWIQATLARDAGRYADLFLRDHEAFVAWASGDVSRGWSAIYDHALRQLYHAKVHVRKVDLENPHVVRLGDTLTTTFVYDVHFVDFWGTAHTSKRLASMTLARTKDGLRIASAHFSNR